MRYKFRVWDKRFKFMTHELPEGFEFRLDGKIYLNNSVFKEFTLMQYTGLKDKNGKEIYEGDVLQLDGGGEPAKGQIDFIDGCFIFKAPWIEPGKSYPELKYYIDMDFVDAEIIGNIYENSDLLND